MELEKKLRPTDKIGRMLVRRGIQLKRSGDIDQLKLLRQRTAVVQAMPDGWLKNGAIEVLIRDFELDK